MGIMGMGQDGIGGYSWGYLAFLVLVPAILGCLVAFQLHVVVCFSKSITKSGVRRKRHHNLLSLCVYATLPGEASKRTPCL